MRELGERLRQAREAKGLTIEELSSRTKISPRYLEAIETGEFGAIRGQVYLRGFLRNYADAVGLDPQAVLGELSLRTQEEEREETIPDVGDEHPPAIRSGFPVYGKAWLALAAGGLILAILCIFLFRSGKKPETGRAPERAAVADERPNDGPTGPEADSGVHRDGGEEALVLVLRYTARCWVRIFCDGRQVFEGTLAGGDVQRWSAGEEIKVMLGNSGGVQGELNGEALPTFGATGVSVTRVFRAGEPD